jgi:hypothetical protein
VFVIYSTLLLLQLPERTGSGTHYELYIGVLHPLRIVHRGLAQTANRLLGFAPNANRTSGSCTHSVPSLTFDENEIRKVEVVSTEYGNFKAPIPRRQHLRQWDEVISQQEADILKKIKYINEFQDSLTL